MPPPLLAASTALLMWLARVLTPAGGFMGTYRVWAALALGLLSLAFMALAIRSFSRARTTIDPRHPERASSLVTGGVFAVTRNPMYLGLVLLLTAWAVFLGSPWLLAGPLVFGLLINQFQIAPEERAMRDKFGQAYADYCKRARRWI